MYRMAFFCLPWVATWNIPEVVLIYYAWQVGIRDNEGADILASRAPITWILTVGTGEIMRENKDSVVRDDTVVELHHWVCKSLGSSIEQVAVTAGEDWHGVLLINVRLGLSASTYFDICWRRLRSVLIATTSILNHSYNHKELSPWIEPVKQTWNSYVLILNMFIK